MSKQLNVRLPNKSSNQLHKLQKDTGMTQVQIVIVALDRMYREEERTKKMINHEIYIYDFTGDLNEVNAALNNAAIQTNPEEATALNKESSVFVSPSQIGQAVDIIDGLGWKTDEDEDEDEDEE